MSLRIATRKLRLQDVWKCYIKLSDFKAQCTFCEKKYYYIRYHSFKIHMKLHHRKIYKFEEERKPVKWPWIYFKYINKFCLKCIICNAKIPSKSVENSRKSVENHLNSHSEKQWEDHVPYKWLCKYCTQRDDFVIECNICHKNVHLSIQDNLKYHITKKHSDKLENIPEIPDTVDTSKCVSLLETDTMSMSSNVATNITKKNLWIYYIKLSEFKAQCMFCENKYRYVKNSDFQRHVRRRHKEIWKYETEREAQYPWKYFKYLNESSLQCIICDTEVQSASVKNHLNSHSKKQQETHIVPRSWLSKYWLQRNDFVVECNICHKNICLGIRNNLENHITKKHSDKLEKIQEIHDTIDTSKCVSSLKTDTMSMSSNIATNITKKNLWTYYIKLSDFQAQCMFCENIYRYVKDSDFQRHVRMRHKDIWKYETERKVQYPWIYFKYLNESSLQCIICDTEVQSASVKNHLNSHSKKQQETHIVPRSWSSKYWLQRNDFVVVCDICHRNISLHVTVFLEHHITKKHPDKLTNIQEIHDTVDTSKCVLSLETDTTSMSPKDSSTEMSNFWMHIKEMHGKVFSLEEKFRSLHGPSRIYFKYFNSLALKCIICDESVLFLSECLEDHLRSHSKKQLEKYTFHNWLWKYCTKSNNFEVVCNICHENISIAGNYLNDHTKDEEHLANQL